ncbi:hypothetical protein AUEXF2481DRAFT_416583 [Aureobasidium subglaciale EXF-2481]|uniref:Uncharacterized protein n=1 Tax=Aureobasidium subglaciale (strain EXF-2481) TaxID=1043005 RepID=A0A074Y4K7_AURSE|nr:uncharacterized protein AUEXF2481DRAFT_416583 [Aureobasidium subglaciale EXF-2481]KEQ92718.1 hypothetical protein AUEXF2481DRAFT_416583 [Aureobasidium subglaciale EXF-2481]
MSHQSHLAFSTVVFPNRLAMSDGMSATQLDLMSDSCFTSDPIVRCCSGIALRPSPGIVSHHGCCIEPWGTRLWTLATPFKLDNDLLHSSLLPGTKFLHIPVRPYLVKQASKRPNSRFLSGAWHFARLLDVIFDGMPEYQSTDGQVYVGKVCIIHTLYMDI